MSFTSIPFTSLTPFPPTHIPPPNLRIEDNGKVARFGCAGKPSDWWRVPFPAPGRDEAHGPGIGVRRKVGREGFEVRVGLEVGAKVQAQLIVYLSPTEWVKTGAEYDNDALWHGVVVCNPFSDWSIQHPAKPSGTFTISFDPSTTTLRVFLNDDMIREVKSFGIKSAGIDPETVIGGDGSIDPAERLKDKDIWIGVMACSPKGPNEVEEMAEAVFRDLEVREGTR